MKKDKYNSKCTDRKRSSLKHISVKLMTVTILSCSIMIMLSGCNMTERVNPSRSIGKIKDKEPPQIQVISDQVEIELGQPVTFDQLAQVSDDQKGAVLTISSEAGENAVYIDNVNQSLIFRGVGDFVLNLAATDVAENTAQAQISVKVQDTAAPNITSYSETVAAGCDIPIILNDMSIESPLYVEAEDGSAITYAVANITDTADQVIGADICVNEANTLTFYKPGQYKVIMTATDAYGQQSVCQADVNVVDNMAPEILDYSKSVSVYFDKPLKLETQASKKGLYVVAQDRGAITYKIEEVVDGQNAPLTEEFGTISGDTVTFHKIGTYSMTISVTDEYDNKNTCFISVKVKEKTPPKITKYPKKIKAKVDEPIFFPDEKGLYIEAEDESPVTYSISKVLNKTKKPCKKTTFTSDENSVTFHKKGNFYIKLAATDDSSNKSTCLVKVVVK